jgi:flagellar M-ring protein FliF
VETIVKILRDLGPGRVSAIGGITVIAVLFFLFLTARLSTPLMSPLYSDLQEADSQEIVAYLSSQGIDHQTRKGGSEITVPTSVLAELRMQLSQLGLPRTATIGNELFDQSGSFDTASSFEQEVMRVRALEGELARTIVSLENVKSARVHIVLPRRELFDREERQSSASVVLNMRGSHRLDREQIQSIQHLISTAVPGLKAGNISMIDSRGNLLVGGAGEDGLDGGGNSQEEKRTAYEGRMARQIETLLENAVGYGRARVQVTADMDFSKTVIQEEEYNPEGQVLRSTELVEEQDLSRQGGPEAVSVRGNLPEGGFGEEGSSLQENRVRTEERANYEISRTTRNRVIAPGEVRHLSVAALVDGHYRLSDDGVEVYQARGEEEMAQLEELIKSAIGFSPRRSDTVSVVNMQFAPLPADDVVELQTLFGFTTAQLSRLIEVMLLTLFGVLVILLLLRPLIVRIFESTPQALALAGSDDEGGVHQIGFRGGRSGERRMVMKDGQLTEIAGDDGDLESMIDIANVQGQVRAGNLKKIGEMIQGDPEAAVSVIRNWLYVDAS